MGEIGETGKTVAANIERLRLEQGLSVRVLCVRLGDLGRPIWPSMVHVICQGERHVDVDDLVAFARVLGVRPAALLEPPGALTVSG